MNVNSTGRIRESKVGPRSVDMAAWAASQGWTVVKVWPGTKVPAEKWRELGYRDPDTVRREWQRDRPARRPKKHAGWVPAGRDEQFSVGILTGPSRLVCDDLDVDVEGNPAGQWDLENLLHVGGHDWNALPGTFELSTPSGGRQLIWAQPHGREYKTSSDRSGERLIPGAPHIDVRGRGGMFVLSDPRQPDRIIIDARPPAPMPRWLSELHPEPDSRPDGTGIRSVVTNEQADAWLRKYGDGDDEPCVEMARTRDKHLARLADGTPHDEMRDGTEALVGDREAGHVGLNVALAALHRAYDKAMRGKSRERDKDIEWDAAVAGAIADKTAARGKPRRTDPCDVGSVEDVMGAGTDDADDPAERARARKLLAGMRNGTWLQAQTFAPVQFAIPEIVPEGASLLSGPPKVGKSILNLRFGLECARGGEVFGMECDKRRVLYIALEDRDRRMQERCFQLLGEDDIPEWFDYILEVKPGKLIATVRAYIAEYSSYKPLVLVDTLGKVLEPQRRGETTYDRDYRMVCDLKAQADRHPGSAVIASHHTNKSKEANDWLNLVSGTNAIAGAVDTVLVLSRQRGGNGDGTLRITSREIDDGEYALSLEKPLGWRLDGDDLLEAAGNANKRGHTDRRGNRSLKIVDFVNDNPNGVTAKMVAKKFKDEFERDSDAEFNERTASTYLSQALARGDISKIKTGLYGPVVKSRVGGDD